MVENMETEEKGVKVTLNKIIGLPIFLGIVIGILAAFLQSILLYAGGPTAYAFCVVCHTRDMANWLFNFIFQDKILGIAPLSLWITVLTPLGVILGAFISSKAHKEFRWKKADSKKYFLYFVGGILVMFFGLMLGACPYRAALRLGYGDLMALIGILAIFGGVAIGSFILLKKEGA